MFYTAVPVDPGKTLTSVTLPSGSSASHEHIFSIGTSTTAAMTGPVVTSLSTTSAQAGDQVTINGSGFGSSQGNGYVAFSDNGTNWGSPRQHRLLHRRQLERHGDHLHRADPERAERRVPSLAWYAGVGDRGRQLG